MKSEKTATCRKAPCCTRTSAIRCDGAQIGKNCVVGAGAVVTEGKVFPDNVLIVGCPAKVVRELTRVDAVKLAGNAADYVERAQRYKLTLEICEP